MNTYKAGNIPLNSLKKFLKHKGVNHIRTTGGHFVYSRKDLSRSIVVQTHVDPVPEFIVRQILKHIRATTKELNEFCNPPKATKLKGGSKAKRDKRSK